MKTLALAASLLLVACVAFAADTAEAADDRPADLDGVHQFDFMLGEWVSVSHWLLDDLSLDEVRARHHFFPSFGGQGITDDNVKLGDDGEETYWGTAIRTWDPATDIWTCRWYDGELRRWTPEFPLRREGDVMTGAVEGRDEHGAYRSVTTFAPQGEDVVLWTTVRTYAGGPEPFETGRIVYRRLE